MKKKKRKGLTSGRSMRCPYCGSYAVLRSADGIYHVNNDNAKLYVCSKYPACDAYVRVQEGTNIPAGSMANGDLRALRIQAHRCFDKLHQSGMMSRRNAYAWLAEIVAAPLAHAHIGQLGEYSCKVVIKESQRFFENNRTRIRAGMAIAPNKNSAGGERNASERRAAAVGAG